ncbi:BRO-N domain-containing protein [Solidesulfovibrio sp.]
MSGLPETLSFGDVNLSIIDRSGTPWIRGAQIEQALGYTRQNAVQQLYERNKDEFAPSMTATVELDTPGGRQVVRIFSPRGCHLLAIFARTPKAKEFRRWVLDVLDAQGHRKYPGQALPSPRTRNTLDDYKALYSSLPSSPKYFLDLLTEYANAHDVLARKLEEVKTEATKPFRVGRKFMVQTYFDAAMSPMYSLFDNAEKTLHLSYCQMFDALHGCRNIWLLLHKG